MKLHPLPENPPPAEAECLELVTADKVRLRAMRAVPEAARGTVVIVGGRGDYIERYFETARELIARGFAVATVDLRGQGGSQRVSGHRYRDSLRSFAEFDEDLRTLVEGVVIPSCPAPSTSVRRSSSNSTCC